MTERQTWPDHAWPTPEQWLEWRENLHDLRNGLMKLQSELEALRDSIVAQSPDDASEGLPESLSEPQSLPDANWIAPALHDGERSSHT
jgi:hypothetical protein